MPKNFVFLLIGLFFGCGPGLFLPAANNASLDGHDHPTPGAHGSHKAADGAAAHGAHDELISLPAGHGAPTLDMRVLKDPAAGWNLEIVTTNFRFAPEQASADHRPGEGHAHVYVNGKKLARVYGRWFHNGEHPKGKVEISVTLNANSNVGLAVGDVPLKVTKSVAVD